MLGYWGFVPWKETILKSRAAAIKALEIDETLAEAHVSLGNVRAICHWDLSGAEREYRRALELNPDHAMAHYSLCHYTLAQSGRFDEALAHIFNLMYDLPTFQRPSASLLIGVQA